MFAQVNFWNFYSSEYAPLHQIKIYKYINQTYPTRSWPKAFRPPLSSNPQVCLIVFEFTYPAFVNSVNLILFIVWVTILPSLSSGLQRENPNRRFGNWIIYTLTNYSSLLHYRSNHGVFLVI